jgi:hypothetical protein
LDGAVIATAAMALAACGGNGNSATQSTALLQAQNAQDEEFASMISVADATANFARGNQRVASKPKKPEADRPPGK